MGIEMGTGDGSLYPSHLLSTHLLMTFPGHGAAYTMPPLFLFFVDVYACERDKEDYHGRRNNVCHT